ncbi:hypothetical protein [Nocardioides sp.]|uniref:hypothetical protein n=1 Tax=Nocardioides sp. TaxID=35761 RepID=UPI003569D7D6
MDDAMWVTVARSALAALADGARTLEGSSAYEHVLIDFDEAAPRWYGAIEHLALKEPAALVELAERATERVERDGLRRALILAELLDAWELDHADRLTDALTPPHTSGPMSAAPVHSWLTPALEGCGSHWGFRDDRSGS